MEKKTSKEWLSILKQKYTVEIHEPDGWDRENLKYSFIQEEITADEFLKRLNASIIEVDSSFLKAKNVFADYTGEIETSPRFYDETLPKMKRQDKIKELLPGLRELILSLNSVSADLAHLEVADNLKAYQRVRKALIDHEKAVRDYRYIIDNHRKEAQKVNKIAKKY